MKMILLLYFIALSILSYSTGDLGFIDSYRVDNRGNAFCIAFFKNSLINTTTTLKLHLLTDEIEAVQVIVSFHSESSISVTVDRNATTVIDISSDLVITPSTLTRNAISVQTVNPNHSVSVFCQNSQQNRSDVFVALPIREYKDILQYEYAHFSSQPIQNDYSTFILSNCKDEFIVPVLQSPTQLSGLIPVRDVYRQFADSREFIEDRPTPLRRVETFESFHFENGSLDLTGIKAWDSKPFSFISGHVCTNGDCDHFSQQIPPSYTWGYTFCTFPVEAINVSSYTVKMVAAYNTDVTYYCNNGSNNSIFVTDESYTLFFQPQDVCIVSSNRPIGVVQIFRGVDGGGAMTWLPPINQYINEVSFTIGLLATSSDIKEFVWVTVPVENFNASLIKLDGLVLHENQQSWTEITCSLMEVCVYGAVIQLTEGKHTIGHDGSQGCLSVIIFGSSEVTNYAYSAGYGMNPIGIPIVSFTQSLYIGSESVQPNVTLSRTGDVNVAIDVIVQIKNIPLQDSPSSNEDFVSFNETIHFNVGQRNAMVPLRVRDDLRVETVENFTLQLMKSDPTVTNTIFQPLEEVILQIHDNDVLVVGFTVASVNVSEELEQLVLTLTSNIPLQDSGMNIRVFTEDGTANDTFDYVRLSDNFFLRPGESEWPITVTITDDERLEEIEHFFVSFTVVVSAVDVTIATRRVQINIIDTDSVTVHFMRSSFTVNEFGVAQITMAKDGTNDIPVHAIINTENDTALAGLDYERLDNVMIEFGIKETESSINVTILPDSRLEIDEVFIVRLSSEPNERVNFDFGNSADVVITDDDSVEIGFTNDEYPTNENSGVAVITVDIKQGIADRPFAFHVQTIQQQATEGLDYEELDSDLEFPPFQSSFSFNVAIIDNKIAEAASEGFTIILTNSQSDNLDIRIVEFARTTVAITEDDDVLIRMDIADSFIAGSEGGPDLRIRLVKTGDIVATVPVSIALFVEEEDATQDVDFTIDEVVEFGPDENEQYATIQLLPDTERESTESFVILLVPFSGPVTVDLNQFLLVSIFDADTTTVEFSLPMYTVNEGQNISLMLTVIGSLDNSIPVTVTVSPITASGDDFIPLNSDAFTIPAGVAKYNFSIQTVNDEYYENTENLTVSIEIGDGAVTGPQSTTVVRIMDNDAIHVGLAQATIVVDESTDNVTIAVQKIGLSEVNITLLLTIEEQSARDSEDFLYIGNSVITIPAEESNINITVQIIDDEVVEVKEESLLITITSSLLPGVLIGNNNSTRIIITDDDALEVLFNQTTYSVSENNNAVLINIISRGTTDIPLSVMAMSMDGSAIGGEDYRALSTQSLTFNRSVSEHLLSVTLYKDLILEGTQEFYINIQTDSDLVFIPAEFNRATIEITDGPLSDVVVSINTSNEIVYENNPIVVFIISITGQRQTNVFIMFKTEPGSAIAVSDYTPLTTSMVFAVDDTDATISVRLVNDDISEVKENFYGTIDSSEASITFSNNQSEVIVKDDEGAVLMLERSMYTVNEGETKEIHVLRSVDITNDIDIIITTTGGDAQVGTDFTPVENKITIQSGNMSIQIASLTPRADGLFENVNETFEISISLPDGQLGAVIVNDKATVVIVDQDVLVFTGDNVLASELNSTVIVCFSSNIPNTIPIEVQLIYSPSFTSSAEANKDYNITQSLIIIPKSPRQQPPSFCATINILMDNEQEQDEHLCLTAVANNTRISFEASNSSEYCPAQTITVTIEDTSIPTIPICLLEDAMVVTPFPKPSILLPSYGYHGNCEHVLVQQCSIKPLFTINVDHDPDDLAVSRVAIRLNTSFIVIRADDLTYTTNNFTEETATIENGRMVYDNEVSVILESDNVTTSLIKIDILKLGITVQLSNDLVNATTTVTVNVTNYSVGVYGDVCGLCGTVDGIMLYSDQTNQLISRNSQVIEDFARSWFVNPEDQITSDTSRDCGALGNDSVVGDPLYSVPVYSSNVSLQSVSLCFEIHGAVNKIFNLVSDRCVSVNALYSSMINPNDGNIITSIGIKAVDNEGTCVNIAVTLSQQCVPVVDSISSVFYSRLGVSVRKRGDKVSVSVPNCENERLVMWMFCRTIGGQNMLDFTIRRGLNLRPTSHGLMGQFWNVPVKLFSYHTELPEQVKEYFDSDKLYLVTIEDPISLIKKREFIGELSKRTWDKSLRSCLYVGSSQGGKQTDIPGPKDSVIEGTYSEYIVSDGILGTSFTFSKFDKTVCL